MISQGKGAFVSECAQVDGTRFIDWNGCRRDTFENLKTWLQGKHCCFCLPNVMWHVMDANDVTLYHKFSRCPWTRQSQYSGDSRRQQKWSRKQTPSVTRRRWTIRKGEWSILYGSISQICRKCWRCLCQDCPKHLQKDPEWCHWFVKRGKERDGCMDEERQRLMKGIVVQWDQGCTSSRRIFIAIGKCFFGWQRMLLELFLPFIHPIYLLFPIETRKH